ncbi:MAG: type III-A CRISPR-associated RAMP protein Csm4, partial [Acidobacteriota bacterium]
MSTPAHEPALLVRLRPNSPWRIGGDSPRQDEVHSTFPSDRLFSAMTQAMAQFGQLADWLAATVEAERPAVRFTSMFPFFGKQYYAPAPVTLWPPAHATAKMNWHSARLIPLGVVDELLGGEVFREDRWEVDGLSGCLLPAGSQTPFRERQRSTAPVDRISRASAEAHGSACLEFNQGVGLWFAAVFADEAARERWDSHLRASLRWLADSGFGAGRSQGWGRAESPEFQAGAWPYLLVDNSPGSEESGIAHWLLSGFIPAGSDTVDWKSGHYELRRRHGRVESLAGWGAEKKSVNMVREGGVLVAEEAPRGTAVDVAPEGFAHSVWRAGFAVAIPVPWKAPSFQLPLPPARPEPVRRPEPEAEPVLA